jgi:hypothetical protein
MDPALSAPPSGAARRPVVLGSSLPGRLLVKGQYAGSGARLDRSAAQPRRTAGRTSRMRFGLEEKVAAPPEKTYEFGQATLKRRETDAESLSRPDKRLPAMHPCHTRPRSGSPRREHLGIQTGCLCPSPKTFATLHANERGSSKEAFSILGRTDRHHRDEPLGPFMRSFAVSADSSGACATWPTRKPRC